MARTEGRDYWKAEEFVYDEEKLVQLLKDNKPIDYVVTHTASEFCLPVAKGGLLTEWVEHEKRLGRETLLLECQTERMLMARVYNVICEYNKPKKWFYGHFHNNYREFINGTEFVCLGIGEITNV